MKFNTFDEAEDYFWKHIARHNEDYVGRDNWIEDQEIQELIDEEMTLGSMDRF
jgi:hypothetical protein